MRLNVLTRRGHCTLTARLVLPVAVISGGDVAHRSVDVLAAALRAWLGRTACGAVARRLP